MQPLHHVVVAVAALAAAALYLAPAAQLGRPDPGAATLGLVVGLAAVALVARGRGPLARRLLLVAATFGLAASLLPYAVLLVWNVHSPLFASVSSPRTGLVEPAAALVALALPLAVGHALARAGERLAARSPPAAAAAGVAFLLVALVAVPVACDFHESWEDTPNRACFCNGWTVRWYPPGLSDGATVEYCIGPEETPVTTGA